MRDFWPFWRPTLSPAASPSKLLHFQAGKVDSVQLAQADGLGRAQPPRITRLLQFLSAILEKQNGMI
jgi:hypothetical protein